MTGTNDPYRMKMFTENPFVRKRTVHGAVVAVLRGHYDRRGLGLIEAASRAVRTGEIHELIATDEPGGSREINRIAYLGFFEVTRGGVILKGDRLFAGGEEIGEIAGFDETHMPNHLNVVIQVEELRDGVEAGWQPETELVVQYGPSINI